MRGGRLERDGGGRVEAAGEGLGVSAEQRPDGPHRLLEAREPILDRNAADDVVALGRARAEPGDEPAVRKDVEGREGLGRLRRPADGGKADRRRQPEISRDVEHRREGGEPVEPWPAKHQVVVGGQPVVPQLGRRGRVGPEPGRGLGRLREGNEGKVGADLHRSGDPITTPPRRASDGSPGPGGSVWETEARGTGYGRMSTRAATGWVLALTGIGSLMAALDTLVVFDGAEHDPARPGRLGRAAGVDGQRLQPELRRAAADRSALGDRFGRRNL